MSIGHTYRPFAPWGPTPSMDDFGFYGFNVPKVLHHETPLHVALSRRRCICNALVAHASFRNVHGRRRRLLPPLCLTSLPRTALADHHYFVRIGLQIETLGGTGPTRRSVAPRAHATREQPVQYKLTLCPVTQQTAPPQYDLRSPPPTLSIHHWHISRT